jgi:uncharacterized protein (DUF58 family)
VVYIALTLLLGFAAVNTGNNLIYLLVSALLGFMVVSGILGRGNLRHLHLDLLFPDEIYAGIPTLITLRLTNGRRRSHAFLLRVLILDQAPLFVAISRRESATTTIEVTFQERGVRNLTGIRLSSIFPINFFRRSFPLTDVPTVTVFPAPRPCQNRTAEGSAPRLGERPLARLGLDGDLAGIADYSGSEPMKSIHWKLSARHDQLKIKKQDATTTSPLIVELDELPGAGLEERLSCASFLINNCSRAGRPVGLKLGGRVLEPSTGRPHKLRLLKELAGHGHN